MKSRGSARAQRAELLPLEANNHRPAGDRDPPAPTRFPRLLALEIATSAAVHGLIPRFQR